MKLAFLSLQLNLLDIAKYIYKLKVETLAEINKKMFFFLKKQRDNELISMESMDYGKDYY